MIFISAGSLKYDFHRLFEYIDQLIENEEIRDGDVFAQTGKTKYEIKHYKHVDNLSRDELNKNIEKCDLLICHCGTGTIMTAFQKNKKVIVVPRRESLNEHKDDHQFEIANELSKDGYILVANDIDELSRALIKSKSQDPKQFHSHTDEFIASFRKELEKLL